MKQAEVIPNTDIVMYALFKLGGATKKIHTEKIAWESYDMAEDKFCWTLPEFRKRGFPDKTTARYALESAKKLKLISGRAGKDKGGKESEGWQFTPEGVNWILKNEKRISRCLEGKEKLSEAFTPHKAQRYIKSIKGKKIFTEFIQKNSLSEATVYDFIDLLNCSPDASKRVIKTQFDLLRSNVNLLNDGLLKKFVKKCEIVFKNIL